MPFTLAKYHHIPLGYAEKSYLDWQSEHGYSNTVSAK